MLALEHPRDESREPSGHFLQPADALEVLHAVLKGFAAAEHHGGGSAQAELVRRAMHRQPLLRRALQAGDASPNLVVENFRAPAGNGVESGIHQARNRIAQAEV